VGLNPPQNLCIIWDNRYFDAAILTPSSEVATLPARNLQDPQRTRPWRTEGIIDQSLTVDFGAPVPVTCLGLIDHNFTVTSQITLQASNDAGFAELLKGDQANDTFDVWQPLFGAGEGGAGAHGAGGYPLDSERSFYTPRPICMNYFRPVSTEEVIEARYWRLLFNDPDNPDSYFQIGRIFLCMFDEYITQFSWGWGLSGDDQSIINTSPGGQDFISACTLRQGRRLPWAYMPSEDFYWKFMLFLKQMGISKQFIIDLFPAGDPSKRFFNLIYCRLSSINEQQQNNPNLYAVEMEVIESL
jgi:hypothetical protein